MKWDGFGLGSGEVARDVGEDVGFSVAVEADVAGWVDGCDDGVGDGHAVGEVEVGDVWLSGCAWVDREVSAFVADFGIDNGDVQYDCTDTAGG